MKVKIPFIIVLTLFFMGCNSNKEVKVENKTKTTKINFILETSGGSVKFFV